MSESVEQARRALWVAYGDAGHQGHWDQLADALIAAAKREAYETGYGNGESSRSADYMAALNEADLIPDGCEASPMDVIRLWRESLAAAKREAVRELAEEIEREASAVPLGEAFNDGGGLRGASKHNVFAYAVRRVRQYLNALTEQP